MRRILIRPSKEYLDWYRYRDTIQYNYSTYVHAHIGLPKPKLTLVLL